jgi:hypothetical protein
VIRFPASSLWWLVQVEAAMQVHRRVYPGDWRWRRWIRRTAQELPPEWYERIVRQAQAVLEGRARRFLDPEDAE